MNVVMFYHSLLSDGNHGNAHFLRGIVAELQARGHSVWVYEPADGWSRKNLIAEHGVEPLRRFRRLFSDHGVPEVFSRARVTIHVPRRPYARRLRGIPTIRPFEALACGIPLICAPWCDDERLFRPGRDCLTDSDVGVLDNALEEGVLELQGPSHRVVFWDVDAPATLERVRQVEQYLLAGRNALSGT